ncbi:MAG: hypothetical protein R3C18_08100 [Planctomycetaceae bacterium]
MFDVNGHAVFAIARHENIGEVNGHFVPTGGNIEEVRAPVPLVDFSINFNPLRAGEQKESQGKELQFNLDTSFIRLGH